MSRNLSPKAGRRVSAIAYLCALAGVSMALALKGVDRRISAQSLLREAVHDNGPLEEIFAQQAGQGYYDDAVVTAHIATSNIRNQEYEFSGWAERLIEIRAENGDIEGAKEMVRHFNETALATKAKVTLEIAKTQVDQGDLHGALETCVSNCDVNEVMEEFGNRQIGAGDLEGALQTAEHVDERSAYDLYYNVGSALRERGEPQRLRALASHMTDKKSAAKFLGAARVTLEAGTATRVIKASACDMAAFYANDGRFTDAWGVIELNKCEYSAYIATREYASNPGQAERELLKSANKSDVTYGIGEMSKAAAKRGDISNALRLLNIGRRISADPDFCQYCVRDIAWGWALKRQPGDALDWARSLPVPNQRGYALLGIAQALARPRSE